jgi:hypothetical protein
MQGTRGRRERERGEDQAEGGGEGREVLRRGKGEA